MDNLERLSELAEEQSAAETAVAEAIVALDMRKRELADLAEKQVPELMEECGFAKFVTTSGLTIEVSETLRANITKANAPAAMDWLRDNGHGSLIKRTLTVFPMDDDQGTELCQLLDDYDMADKAAVNAQTLSKFVREKMAEGEDIPQDIFSVFRQRKAKVKR